MGSSIAATPEIPKYIIDGMIQLVLSVFIPLIVAYLGTRAQIASQRRKEQRVEEAEWFRKTASLCQLIKWSFAYTDEEYDISHRLDGISLNELGSETELAYLDEKMLDLLNHGSTAPKSIDEETIMSLKKIVFEYAHPKGTLESSDLTFGDLAYGVNESSEGLEKKIDELHRIAKEEEKKRTPKQSYLRRGWQRLFGN